MDLIEIGRKFLSGDTEFEVCGYAYLGERYYFLKDNHGTVSLFPEDTVYDMVIPSEIIKPEEHEREP